MEAQVVQTEHVAARRVSIPAIRWSAIIAGTVAGLASYMLLGLLGIAIGLTAVDPQAAPSAGVMSLSAAIWNGISMLIAAFIGAYVAARMSGLARRADGFLHGLVSWATTMVLFAWLATTAVGAVIGGAFSVLSQGAQITAQAAGGGDELGQQLQSIITGSPSQAQITPDSLSNLRQRLEAGDRTGAIDYMVSTMGFARDRATVAVDNLMPLVGPGGEQRVQQAADTAVGALSAASWSLFIGIVLALIVALWGGLMGARAISERTLGDHSDERHFRTF